MKNLIIKKLKFYCKLIFIILCIHLVPFEVLVLKIGNFNEKDLLNWSVPKESLPLVYSSNYNIDFWGLEKLHPFDSKKYLHVYEELNKKFGWTEKDFIAPGLPEWSLLSYSVSGDLFWKLQNPLLLGKYSEVAPVVLMPRALSHIKLVNPMRTASLGSVMAAKVALARGWAINIGGGYHHAHEQEGGGFCLIPDISLIVKWLRNAEYKINRFMIIDLDAHQGNGHERDFINDKNVYIFDMYNKDIYPKDEFAKTGIDYKVELSDFTKDELYISELKKGLDYVFKDFNPELIIYNAGTDVLDGDPLGSMWISPQAVIERDELVFKAARTRNIPIVMLLSGGYQKSNAKVIADSISNIWNMYH